MVDEVESRIVAHLPYARAVASRAIDPRCHGADREDLIAWGVLGLVQARCGLEPLIGGEGGVDRAEGTD